MAVIERDLAQLTSDQGVTVGWVGSTAMTADRRTNELKLPPYAMDLAIQVGHTSGSTPVGTYVLEVSIDGGTTYHDLGALNMPTAGGAASADDLIIVVAVPGSRIRVFYDFGSGSGTLSDVVFSAKVRGSKAAGR